MPLNKFFIYSDAAARLKRQERKVTVSDLAAAIGIALSGKGMEKYFKRLDGDDGK